VTVVVKIAHASKNNVIVTTKVAAAKIVATVTKNVF
jgi:hypothetical protein